LPEFSPKAKMNTKSNPNYDAATAALNNETEMAMSMATAPDGIENPVADSDRVDTANPTPGAEEQPIPLGSSDEAAISSEVAPLVETQSPEQVPAEEPVQVTTGHLAERVPVRPVDDPTKNFKRGPRCKMPSGPRSSKESQQQLAAVSAEEGIAVGIVSLDAAKVTKHYKMILKQDSLGAALTFNPDDLTSEDKSKVYEVILHGKEVQDRLNAALARRGLNACFEPDCPDEPMILEARLSRVLPHTPSLSISWPADLKGPTRERTKALIVPVMKIRVQPEEVQDTTSSAIGSSTPSAQES
jgi:hypothetical protein